MYLVHKSSRIDPDPDPSWFGYWEGRNPPRPLESGAWSTASQAISWALQRAPVIIVRVGLPSRQYSAGPMPSSGEDLPAWPPDDIDDFDP